jgi:UDP-N-acetyl-D-galactosamine dehydrogenase
MKANYNITVVGLGYVGLPLAVEFAKRYPTIGFDINQRRIDELKAGFDRTLEVDAQELEKVLIYPEDVKSEGHTGLRCTSDIEKTRESNFYIITVPTPTDKNHRPVLKPLINASRAVGGVLRSGDYVIYESTVYPGVTEDECVPILEQSSALRYNHDFFVGYSPERINPGDKERTLTKILKITSGSTLESAKVVDDLYKSIITAGTFLASSIRVAEAAKVIENSQRDINIAFVNELAKIFNRLNIDTRSVLEAASTKWNFLPFSPGLVGGHCIGVDPYYLAQKAQEVGYHPEIILSGRRLNDDMGRYVANEVIKLMINKGLPVKDSSVLMLGITFKENCPDIRNTKAIDVFREIQSFGCNVDVMDPWADEEEVHENYGFGLTKTLVKKYSAVVLAVAHEEFNHLDIQAFLNDNGVIYDVKGFFPSNRATRRL